MVSVLDDSSVQQYDSRWEALWVDGIQPGDRFDMKETSKVLLDIINGQLDMNGKRALVPGCGRGYDVINFVKAGAQFALGLDLSETAVQEAEKYTDSLGLSQDVKERVQFRAANFFKFQDEEGGFDVGYDYTFLCAIHPELRTEWSKAWFKLIKPGGELITLIFPIVEIRNPGPPWKVTPEETKSLLIEAGFVCEQLEEAPSNLSFKERIGQEYIGRWRKPLS